MADVKDANVETVEDLKAQLSQVSIERDQYKQAYEQVLVQNTNLWGLYSNTLDYIVTQTQRKQ